MGIRVENILSQTNTAKLELILDGIGEVTVEIKFKISGFCNEFRRTHKDLQFVDYCIAMLEETLIEWNLVDSNDKPLPFKKTLPLLPDNFVVAMYNAVSEGSSINFKKSLTTVEG